MQRFFDETTGKPPGEVTVDEVYADLDFPAGRGDRPYTVINMVSTLDGKVVVGGPGTTWLMGKETDHLLLRRIEEACDAIMVGAGLMRSDDVPYPRISDELAARRAARGLRPKPLWVIVSGRAELPADLRVFRGGSDNVLVLASTQASGESIDALAKVSSVRKAGEDVLDMAQIGRMLYAEYGVRRMNCLGGPFLNGTLLEAGVIDELFLTLAPKIQGGAHGRTAIEGVSIAAEQMPNLRLRSLYADDGELYLRYAF